jgi:hypothetical protein
MRARTNRPYQQGDLDGFCGLYSIVNAVAVAVHWRPGDGERPLLPVRRFDDRQADQLFDGLSGRVLRSGRLSTFDPSLSAAVLASLLRWTDQHLRHQVIRLIWSKPFHKRKTVDIATVARCFRRHLEAPHTAVIVGYTDHWSVITSASPKRFRLADSSGDLWLATNRQDARRCGVHVSEIQPTSIFLIRLVSAEQPIRRARS